EAIEKGYFCRRADGPLMEGEVWPGMCHFPDFTNPEVREWWAGLYEEFMKCGLSGVWNDMNEPAVFNADAFPRDTRHDYDGHPCSHRKAHNIYGMQMARATFHGVKKAIYPKRPLIITRSGYAGMQRYSAVWTGDNIATWEHLWIANVQSQRLSISGVSFAGSDVGGFIGQPNGELFTRWIQLATFHPYFRTHSSGDHGDQEPWSFGEEYLDIVRKMIEFRYKLLPYIYTIFWRHVQKGTPMLLPLVYLDQNDAETHFRMDEFGFGRDIVVCPITKEGETGRILYLPRGEWYHYWTDKKWEGAKEIWVDAPLDEIPIFIRAGAIIPHYPVQQYVGEKKIEQCDLHVYYREGSYTSELYEDAGDFYDFEQGNFAVRSFQAVGEKTALSIIQRRDGRFNSEYSEFKLIFHGLPFEPAGMMLDGRVAMFDQPFDKSKPFEVILDKNFEEVKLMRLDGFSA
ncbi:MAG: TIM-barrel domain-containing protein, partial [Bacteroidota bacterium]